MNDYTPEQIAEMYERAKHENFKLEIKCRNNSDSHDVYYFDAKTNEQVGYGYIGKEDNEEDHISLVRCPACRRENYYANVLTGACTWCPFQTKSLLTLRKENLCDLIVIQNKKPTI